MRNKSVTPILSSFEIVSTDYCTFLLHHDSSCFEEDYGEREALSVRFFKKVFGRIIFRYASGSDIFELLCVETGFAYAGSLHECNAIKFGKQFLNPWGR